MSRSDDMSQVNASDQQCILAQLCWLQSEHATTFFKNEYSSYIALIYKLLLEKAEWLTVECVEFDQGKKDHLTNMFKSNSFGPVIELPEKMIYLAL